MPTSAKDFERLQVSDRDAWRRWLAANHATAPGVWLVTFKPATGKPCPTYAETVEEALCFGWIDSRAGTLDDERSMQIFTPRKPGSRWSRLNKERVERLIAGGLMTEAGLAKVGAAKADGSWTLADAVEALEMPPDLDGALQHNAAARRHFDAFSPSIKKQLLWWIASAKRNATRADRVANVVAAAAANRNPLDVKARSTRSR